MGKKKVNQKKKYVKPVLVSEEALEKQILQTLSPTKGPNQPGCSPCG